MALRCAILDDYQNVVLSTADWSKVKGDIDIKVFNEHLGGPEIGDSERDVETAHERLLQFFRIK